MNVPPEPIYSSIKKIIEFLGIGFSSCHFGLIVDGNFFLILKVKESSLLGSGFSLSELIGIRNIL